MKLYLPILFLFLTLNITAQKNKNNLKLNFTISETGFLIEPSYGYDVRYERNTFGMSNINIGYGHSEAKKLFPESIRTYSSLGGGSAKDTFSSEQKENFTYFDINATFDVLSTQKRFRLKIGGGIGLLSNQFFYLKTLDFEFGRLSDLEYGRHKTNSFISIFSVEGEYKITEQFTIQMKFNRRRTHTFIQDFEWMFSYRKRPSSYDKPYKLYRVSLDFGVGLYF